MSVGARSLYWLPRSELHTSLGLLKDFMLLLPLHLKGSLLIVYSHVWLPYHQFLSNLGVRTVSFLLFLWHINYFLTWNIGDTLNICWMNDSLNPNHCLPILITGDRVQANYLKYGTLAYEIFQTGRSSETAGVERTFWPPEAGHTTLKWEVPSLQHPEQRNILISRDRKTPRAKCS